MNVQKIRDNLIDSVSPDVSLCSVVCDFGNACHKFMEIINFRCANTLEETAKTQVWFPENLKDPKKTIGMAVLRAYELTEAYLDDNATCYDLDIAVECRAGEWAPDLTVFDFGNEVHLIEYKFGMTRHPISYYEGLKNAAKYYKDQGIKKVNTVLIHVLDENDPMTVKSYV